MANGLMLKAVVLKLGLATGPKLIELAIRIRR